MNKRCNLCQLDKKLVRSHIIPASFYGEGTRIMSINKIKLQRRPNGSYDKEILCGECDSSIGVFDDIAKRILIDRWGIEKIKLSSSYYYKLNNKRHYEFIAKFIFSVLWRMSVSNHKDFAEYDFGKYQDILKNAFTNPAFEWKRFLSVILMTFKNRYEKLHLASPGVVRFDGVNYFVFILASIKVFVRLDQRKAPLKLQAIELSETRELLMIENPDITKIKEFPFIEKFLPLFEKNRLIK